MFRLDSVNKSLEITNVSYSNNGTIVSEILKYRVNCVHVVDKFGKVVKPAGEVGLIELPEVNTDYVYFNNDADLDAVFYEQIKFGWCVIRVVEDDLVDLFIRQETYNKYVK